MSLLSFAVGLYTLHSSWEPKKGRGRLDRFDVDEKNTLSKFGAINMFLQNKSYLKEVMLEMLFISLKKTPEQA